MNHHAVLEHVLDRVQDARITADFLDEYALRDRDIEQAGDGHVQCFDVKMARFGLDFRGHQAANRLQHLTLVVQHVICEAWCVQARESRRVAERVRQQPHYVVSVLRAGQVIEDPQCFELHVVVHLIRRGRTLMMMMRPLLLLRCDYARDQVSDLRRLDQVVEVCGLETIHALPQRFKQGQRVQRRKAGCLLAEARDHVLSLVNLQKTTKKRKI